MALILIKIAENHYQFAMLFNHVIIDEGSICVVLKDISNYYNAAIKSDPSLEPSPIPSLINLQSNLAIKEEKEAERIAYWRNKLETLNSIQLQTDFPSPLTFAFKGKRVYFDLDRCSSTN